MIRTGLAFLTGVCADPALGVVAQLAALRAPDPAPFTTATLGVYGEHDTAWLARYQFDGSVLLDPDDPAPRAALLVTQAADVELPAPGDALLGAPAALFALTAVLRDDAEAGRPSDRIGADAYDVVRAAVRSVAVTFVRYAAADGGLHVAPDGTPYVPPAGAYAPPPKDPRAVVFTRPEGVRYAARSAAQLGDGLVARTAVLALPGVDRFTAGAALP